MPSGVIAHLSRWGDEFTLEMQKGLSPELQKQSFEQIRSMFGDYQEMTFVEALTARFFIPRGTVYRFKGTYSRTSEQPEIRVVSLILMVKYPGFGSGYHEKREPREKMCAAASPRGHVILTEPSHESSKGNQIDTRVLTSMSPLPGSVLI